MKTKQKNSRGSADDEALLPFIEPLPQMGDTEALLDACRKLERKTDALIDHLVQNGWETRPPTLHARKQAAIVDALSTHEERRAFYAADLLKSNTEIGRVYFCLECLEGGVSRRFLRDVADGWDALEALENGKGHPRLPDTRLSMTIAYFDEFKLARQRGTFPTLGELQNRQRQLFGSENTIEAFRKFVSQRRLPWRKDRTGRPPGSKDSPDCDRQRRQKPQRKIS
jgi:hypothetical protein